MALLTIGAFARATQLSPKALRLYDELGLLPPAAVDGETGYRFYDSGQLEQARLIAWLRRLDMPLNRIRVVIGLDRMAAAAEVEAYWAEIVTQTATRGRMVTFLIDHLKGRTGTMNENTADLHIRYAARTDTGKVRMSNEDAAYAGERLFAVADGMRGAAGRSASAAAIAALKPLETLTVQGEALLDALADAVRDAGQAIRAIPGPDDDGEAVTTLTAMLSNGSQLGLVHIGDSRAYLLRDQELLQITSDHSWVQSLVAEGRLTPQEAESHPQRAMLVRAITADGTHEPDLSLHEVMPGDRYLLCSDGLTQVVPGETIASVLRRDIGPEDMVADLIARAHEAGAPDNIACVVAHVVAGSVSSTA